MSDELKADCFQIHHSSLITFPAVDEEHDGDDDEKDDFELEEVLKVEASRFVACYGVEEESAAGEADRQPDDFSLPVPHSRTHLTPRFSNSGAELLESLRSRVERLVFFAEAETNLPRAEFGAAVEA